MSDHSVALTDRLFAILSAFLLPGLIALFGIATVNDTVLTWLAGAQSGPTLVGFLFVLFAALALNLAITAVRWFLFEKFTCAPIGCPFVKSAPALDLAKRKDLDAQYVDLRHQFYYHYLAYANTAVAVPIGVAIWKFGTRVPEPSWDLYLMVCGCAGAVSAVLAMAACDALKRFDQRATQLLGLAPTTS